MKAIEFPRRTTDTLNGYPFTLNALFITAYVLLFRYLPLRDYPVWVYEGLVFKELLAGTPRFVESYALFGYIPPNALSTLFIGTLSFLFPPLAAGKAFVLLTCLLLYTGIYRFIKGHLKDAEAFAAVFALICTFNPCFYSGNLNFLFGLGFAFFSIAVFEKKERLSMPILVPVFFIAYLAHFFSIFILAVYLFIRSLVRRTKLTPLILAVFPEAVLFLHYIMVKDLPPGINPFSLCSTYDGCTLIRFLSDKASLFTSWTAPLPGFPWASNINPILVSVDLLIAAGYAGICLLFLRIFISHAKKDIQAFTVFLFSLLILLLPASAAGIANPGTRLFTFTIVNLIVYVLRHRPRFKGALLAVFFILEILILSHLTLNTQRFNRIVSGNARKTSEAVQSKVYRDYLLSHYSAIRNKDKAKVTPTSIIKSDDWTYREAP